MPGGRPASSPSPSAATFNGKSAPHIPGPLIGPSNATDGLSFTVPVLRHAISASRRHGSRSSTQELQPASVTRTKEPTRYQRTPGVMLRTMRGSLLTGLQRYAGDGSAARQHGKDLMTP